MLTINNIKSAPAANRTRIQRAKHNIHHAANWIIGGYENVMQDHNKDDIEYKEAEAVLNNKYELANEIYHAATTEIYEDGFCGWGGDAPKILNDLRLLGKDTLLAYVNEEIVRQGH